MYCCFVLFRSSSEVGNKQRLSIPGLLHDHAHTVDRVDSCQYLLDLGRFYTHPPYFNLVVVSAKEVDVVVVIEPDTVSCFVEYAAFRKPGGRLSEALSGLVCIAQITKPCACASKP